MIIGMLIGSIAIGMLIGALLGMMFGWVTLLITDSELGFFVTLIVVVLTMGIINGVYGPSDQVQTTEIVDNHIIRLDCPNGTYWDNINGHFFLGSGHLSSNLAMSYTYQFVDSDKILHTRIIDSTSTDLTVHDAPNVSITLTYIQHTNIFGGLIDDKKLTHTDIYLPLTNTG